MTTAFRTCPICDAVCGLKLTLGPDGKVLSVAGDERDPFSQGNICPKGASFGKLDADPDRLRTPRIKVDGQWREATWEEAFQRVDEGLGAVFAEHGRDAVAIYFGNPTFHTMAGFMYRQPLTQSLGGKNVYSASTIDQMPKHVSGGLMFGDPMAIAVPDLDRTDYLLVIGANPVESNGSLCAAPDFAGRLRKLRARGGKVVVVDPRRTRTAQAADEHLFVRPGTDAALLLGVVHTLLAEGLDTVEVDVNGMTELRGAVASFPPEAVAEATGVSADDIRRLARDLAAAPTAAVYTRIGTCTAEFGSVTQWLVDVVNILTGNFDSPGGVMFTRTAALEIFRTGQAFTSGNWRSRVRDLPEVLGEFPVATLADEIETPGEGQVRALISIAGNLALSAPNGPRLGEAMKGLDFMVAVDPYLNETTKHADVILPPPRMTQSPHYDFLLLTVTVRNYARFSPPAVPLEPGQLSEAEILAKLTLILAGAGPNVPAAACDEEIIGQIVGAATQIPFSALAGHDPAEVRASLTGDSAPEVLLDAMLRAGPHGVTLQHLKDNPSGVDLGPLQPRFKELVCTPSGLLEIAPEQLLADLDRLRARLAGPTPEVLLIGRRQLRSNNSWLHNVGSLVGGSNTCTLHVHPDDIARYDLGSHARVTSPGNNGASVDVVVEPNAGIMPGVISLPHGWGHAGSPNRVAAANPGVNANALTDETVLDPLSGNAVFNGVAVTISPIEPPEQPLSRSGVPLT